MIDYNISEVRSSEVEPNSERDKRCAPVATFKNGSCIPLRLLVSMANSYNSMYSDKIILSEKLETLNPPKYKKYLLREFGRRLDDVCDNQRCWVKQSFIKNMENNIKYELQNNVFRPKGPSGRFTWLNTFDINDVMKQYESKYTEFKFLGAVPIDFDDLPSLGIKDMNFENMVETGVHKLGVVFNLDKHDQPGSHWVSMYTDMKKGQVYFSDSYGIEPDKRIRKFMRRVAKYCDDCSINTDVRHNKNRHQYENSECGVYSINFILRLLKGETFDDISGTKVKDREINECRKVYFT